MQHDSLTLVRAQRKRIYSRCVTNGHKENGARSVPRMAQEEGRNVKRLLLVLNSTEELSGIYPTVHNKLVRGPDGAVLPPQSPPKPSPHNLMLGV